MRTGRPIPILSVSDEERETLQQWTRRPKTAQALALRARIILACADGKLIPRWRRGWESLSKWLGSGAVVFWRKD